MYYIWILLQCMLIIKRFRIVQITVEDQLKRDTTNNKYKNCFLISHMPIVWQSGTD